jgi:hypothetical protein
VAELRTGRGLDGDKGGIIDLPNPISRRLQ